MGSEPAPSGYAHLFSRLLSRDRYSRRQALTGVTIAHFRRLADVFERRARWLVIDSAPARPAEAGGETAAFARSQIAGVSMP